jgi:hypothetical protein
MPFLIILGFMILGAIIVRNLIRASTAIDDVLADTEKRDDDNPWLS